MSDFIPKVITAMTKGSDFDGSGKQIEIANFELLTIQEVTERDGREPLYKPENDPKKGQDGKIRRLSFVDKDFDGVRYLDNNSVGFQRNMSEFGIQKGDKGVLRREKINNKVKWYWTKTNV